MANYHSIRSTLKTGDIVLFSGKDGVSNLIKLFSGGKWSHVGMVVRLEEQFGETVLLWESTTISDIRDVITNQATRGVQLVPMSQRVLNYDGEIAVRSLSKDLSKPMLRSLHELRHALSRRPYERNELELLKAAYDGLFGESRREDLSSVFCSELVAEAYQVMGLLPEFPQGLPSNEYTPIDFSSRRQLTLKEGFELGDELVLS